MKLDLADFHSHLVPAVDDGARTVSDSLEGLGRMVEAGVSRVITTPHLQASLAREPGKFDKVMGDRDRAWDLVSEAASKSHPDLDFRRGYEVMLDIPDPDLSDPRLHLGGTSFILVEWPRLQVPPGTGPVLHRIVESGLTPIIAHPERYSGVDDRLRIFQEWKQVGALLQGNYGSLVGRYGPGPKAMIHRLLQAGLLDYLSSDFHARPEYELFISGGLAELEELGAEDSAQILGAINPGRLFQGEPPLPVPPVELPRTLLDRIKTWIAG